MATLKLKQDKPPARTRAAPRGPLRGIAAPRKQVTLAQAQADRAARAEPRRRPADEADPRAAPPARRPARPDRNPRDLRDAAQRGPAPPRRPREPARSDAPPRREPPRPEAAPAREGDRLSKVLTARGVASRREADDWIAAGWVRVDGKLAVLGQRVGPDARIDIDKRAHTEQAQQVTILLHKPIGYVSGQAEDGHEPAVVLVKPENRWPEDRGIKFHAGHVRHLAPAGRLDIDSTGLLVLRQDGRVAKA